MNLPSDIEVIFVDDGSDPPLALNGAPSNFTMLHTNDKRPWTQPIARNMGVRHARGEYVICTDIDHIITRDLISAVEEINTDVLRFKREFGVLDVNGNFTQDLDVLAYYGLPEKRFKSAGLRIRPHSNSYAICRELFLELGGSRENRIMFYPNRDEVPLKSMLKRMQARGEITIQDTDERPTIYMFPVGHYCGNVDCDPLGLFHKLSRSDHKPHGTK